MRFFIILLMLISFAPCAHTEDKTECSTAIQELGDYCATLWNAIIRFNGNCNDSG